MFDLVYSGDHVLNVDSEGDLLGIQIYCYEKLGSNQSKQSIKWGELIIWLRLETLLNNKKVAGWVIKMGDEHHKRGAIQNVIQFVHQYSIEYLV